MQKNIEKVYVVGTAFSNRDRLWYPFMKKDLKPGQEPVAEFVLADGESATGAYEYCNLHGLWKKDI